jgi:hypothetical protein
MAFGGFGRANWGKNRREEKQIYHSQGVKPYTLVAESNLKLQISTKAEWPMANLDEGIGE